MNAKNLGLPTEYLFAARSMFLIYIKGGFNVVADERKKACITPRSLPVDCSCICSSSMALCFTSHRNCNKGKLHKKIHNSLMLREGAEEEKTARQENQSGRKLADHISCSRNLDLPPLLSVFPISSSVWLVLHQEPAAVGRCSHGDDISIDRKQAV